MPTQVSLLIVWLEAGVQRRLEQRRKRGAGTVAVGPEAFGFLFACCLQAIACSGLGSRPRKVDDHRAKSL
jgi:hypothetical protein